MSISVLTSIYEYNEDSHQPARRLSHAELEGGMFKAGGKELRFIDGRPPRHFLAVTAEDVAAAIKALKAAAAPD
jgi:hypothetical protein